MTTIRDATKAIMNDPRTKSNDRSVRIDCVFDNWCTIRSASFCGDRPRISYYFDTIYTDTIREYAETLMDSLVDYVVVVGCSKQEVLEYARLIEWCEQG